MAESSKIVWFFGPGLTQRGLALSGALLLGGTALAFAPVLPRPAFWQMLEAPPPAVAAKADSTWAGHLESPAAGLASSSGKNPSLTSASYTTGFNTANAAPLPAKPKRVARDANVCPENLNCAFRPKLAATAAAPALPPPRPLIADATDSPPTATAHVQPKKPSGIAAWLPRLPSAHTLLKPFASVANAFGGLMHRL